MRSFKRKMLKRECEKQGYRHSSEYVSNVFNTMQVKKYGSIGRLINQAKGTHSKRNWGYRVELLVDRKGE